ncbi:hypothetical protein ACFWBN_19180 [Streptomyces sp. NPDC059989]|uniref:hypothetical protein n=1 Tax=Streptomyces sp. NPDC059989 TaxID=3347026 RepID=UPI00368BBC5B
MIKNALGLALGALALAAVAAAGVVTDSTTPRTVTVAGDSQWGAPVPRATVADDSQWG